MFTGIVVGLGKIKSIETVADTRARIETDFDVATIDIGASIACDGVCLTVVETGRTGNGNWFDVEYSAETISKTNLGNWSLDQTINLERALKIGDELGGHIVSGHVDGVAIVTGIADEGGSTRITFDAPTALAKYIAPKGSVALNGTSLTVNGVDGVSFDINLIPHTKTVTTWANTEVGQKINLEIDTLARYVARLNEFQA